MPIFSIQSLWSRSAASIYLQQSGMVWTAKMPFYLAVVVVLSPEFSTSKYCLEEVRDVMQRSQQGSKQQICPLFFDIAVGDVTKLESIPAEHAEYQPDLKALCAITGMRDDQVSFITKPLHSANWLTAAACFWLHKEWPTQMIVRSKACDSGHSSAGEAIPGKDHRKSSPRSAKNAERGRRASPTLWPQHSTTV